MGFYVDRICIAFINYPYGHFRSRFIEFNPSIGGFT
ncbi:hypothetical protein SAMN05444422_103315 [Halobiforma haloterrestris]|uniref:Uncharacterized protein n=1 Tax=Natronobacterium haloterrestre TaxID=148448 RepID=A0A1I1FEG1_NATHA|nr:hypothetical protein SAMN05444422_103315 [Halobiforma haloterrestris]